jgi:hypothetical protein
MTASTDPITPVSVWEAPPPVLLNAWKHHAAHLRLRIREAVAGRSLTDLAARLVVVGTELMDLYTGRFTPAEIGAQVLEQLRSEGRLEPAAFGEWVAEAGGYRVLTFAEEGSRWVLRHAAGDERYIHVHPARWAPQTRRVRANVLKTAVLALAHAGVHGGDPADLRRVNEVRRLHLGLAPMGRALSGDEGVGVLIELLKAK